MKPKEPSGKSRSRFGLSRRTFLTSVAVGTGASLAPWAAGLQQSARARRATLCTTNSLPLLTPQDFAYLGHYDVQTNGGNTGYAQGLTHRYKNGDFRLLMWQLGDVIHEVSLAGRSYGDLIQTTTNKWPSGTMLDFKGFWWDEPRQRLWSVSCVDYTNAVVPVQIYTRTLNDNGTVTNIRGPVGLQGISAKRVYGGVQPVPAWFQQQYGVGPYVVGWGGYTSLVAQGGAASLGPTMYAIPDPGGYPVNSEIPASAFKTVMDCASGTVRDDWYKRGGTPPFDRGVRLTRPLNYFDGGGDNLPPNGTWSGVPPNPPLASGQWLSPAPDSLGRWVWGDSYYGTGVWIDGPNKQGFVLIASLGDGKCWYNDSTMHYDSRAFELHIYDPTRLGESLQGTRKPWNVKPSSLSELTLPGLGEALNGNGPVLNVGGATYDPMAQRLYVMGQSGGGPANRIYVFSLAGGPSAAPWLRITTPANGKTVHGTVLVHVEASAGTEKTSGVSVYVKGSAASTTTGPELLKPPYDAMWDTTKVPNGTYNLIAVTHFAESPPITVKVAN